MNLSDLIAAFRSDADDQAEPYLFSPEDITAWLNEAQVEACIRARLIFDDTTKQTCQIAVKAGQATYPLDPSILKLDQLRLTSQPAPLSRRFESELDGSNPSWQTLTGTPFCYIEKQEENVIQLVGVPVVDDTLLLAVFRKPLSDMAADADEPEIADHHHRRLVDWALFRAYNRRDADANALALATAADARFTAAFGVRLDANVQRKRRLAKVVTCNPSW
jgi:hypothetical protein